MWHKTFWFEDLKQAKRFLKIIWKSQNPASIYSFECFFFSRIQKKVSTSDSIIYAARIKENQKKLFESIFPSLFTHKKPHFVLHIKKHQKFLLMLFPWDEWVKKVLYILSATLSINWKIFQGIYCMKSNPQKMSVIGEGCLEFSEITWCNLMRFVAENSC